MSATPSVRSPVLAKREELANALTHGLGTALAIAGLVILVVFASLRGTARHIVGATLFGSTMVLLYLMSTLYHSFRGPRVKKVFRALDHASIFLLIAGTYTPLCLATLRGAWGWSLFGLVWGLAILGITLKSILIGRAPASTDHSRPPMGGSKAWEWASLALYLLMGWLLVVAIFPLWQRMPTGGLAWLFGGGACYSLGALVYTRKRMPYAHAIWHLFVLAGTACHFACILGYVIP